MQFSKNTVNYQKPTLKLLDSTLNIVSNKKPLVDHILRLLKIFVMNLGLVLLLTLVYHIIVNVLKHHGSTVQHYFLHQLILNSVLISSLRHAMISLVVISHPKLSTVQIIIQIQSSMGPILTLRMFTSLMVNKIQIDCWVQVRIWVQVFLLILFQVMENCPMFLDRNIHLMLVLLLYRLVHVLWLLNGFKDRSVNNEATLHDIVLIF